MKYTLLSKKRTKAIKQHECIWCGELIKKGEQYLHEKSIYDAHFQNHKWHFECIEACQKEHAGECEYEIEPYVNERPTREILSHNRRV